MLAMVRSRVVDGKGCATVDRHASTSPSIDPLVAPGGSGAFERFPQLRAGVNHAANAVRSRRVSLNQIAR
jgi:hypothetical protein